MTTVQPAENSEKPGVSGFLTAGGVTCAAVTEDFLATRGSMQTRRAYGAAIKGFFRTAGITLLSELHPEVRPPAEVAKLVRAYLDTVTKRAETEPWRVLNPATVNARAEALRAFFAWLMQAYGYPVNPVASAHACLKTARVSSSASLTRGELSDLLQALAGEARRGERELRDYPAGGDAVRPGFAADGGGGAPVGGHRLRTGDTLRRAGRRPPGAAATAETGRVFGGACQEERGRPLCVPGTAGGEGE